jgi:Zn-dependent peptidase ImmA (M78 family)/transcriptional regulator with XRE-family HTH domain
VPVGERVRTGRDIFGYSQVDLARAAGLSQALISHVESGRRIATSQFIDAVAAALDMPPGFFTLTPQEIPLDSLRFRKQATASKVTTARARAIFKEAYRVSSDLIRRVGYRRSDLVVAVGSDLSDEYVATLAAAARQALQLDPLAPIPNVSRSFERAGIAVAPIAIPGTDPVTAAPGHFGLSYCPGQGEHALVGYFPGNSGDRDRFALAHELGHVVLHRQRAFVDDAEKEANLFAGEFLFPRERAIEILRRDTSLNEYARIKATWGISIQAMVMRAYQLSIIDDYRRSSLFRQISSRGWRKHEPVVVNSEEPVLLRRLLDTIYGDTPTSKIAEDLALPAVLLHSLMPKRSQTSNRPSKVVPIHGER